MRYRKTSIYLQYTVLPVHIDIDLYSTIGHVYGDYELTCGVTSMRPSSKQQDLSLQCRCLATPLRAAAGRKPRMMATCHHPQQRYLRSSGINFFPTLPNLETQVPFPFSFLFFFLFFCFFYPTIYTGWLFSYSQYSRGWSLSPNAPLRLLCHGARLCMFILGNTYTA